jgi:myosin heavy subunit
MSWTKCMQKKIVNHYGSEVEQCVDGITKHNWTKILECMVTVLGIADPEIWIPEQIILFTEWSAECLFSEEEE